MIEVSTELLLGIISALIPTLPVMAKIKNSLTQTKVKLSQTSALIIAIESALEDDKITKGELRVIGKYAKELVGK